MITLMARPSKHPPELREGAMRMVMESHADYPHEAAAIGLDPPMGMVRVG